MLAATASFARSTPATWRTSARPPRARGDPPNSGSTLVESGLVHEVHRRLRHDAAAESSLDGDVADDVESADDVLVLHVEANVVRCDERVPESGQGIAAPDMAASVVQPAEYGPTADGILDHVPVREQPQPGVLVVRRYRGGDWRARSSNSCAVVVRVIVAVSIGVADMAASMTQQVERVSDFVDVRPSRR